MFSVFEGKMTAAAFNFLKSIPMFSYLAHAYHIIFVPRGVSSEIQNKVVDQIMQRQREIEDDGSYDPILVAPEGFCSNGTCLMPFKKGAFNSLRQGHPTVIKYQSKKLKPSMAAMEMSIDMILLLTNWYPVTCEITILPAFQPNAYLWNMHKDKGTDKWEIYAWAVRDVMSKVGGFGKSDFTFQEKKVYVDYLSGKKENFITKKSQ